MNSLFRLKHPPIMGRMGTLGTIALAAESPEIIHHHLMKIKRI
jgi:hypothetical protein